jgi:tryptophan-rich sensory protein
MLSITATLSLIVSFVACFLTASSGAVFRPGDWYQNMKRPGWTPPNWMFPVVWSLLYTAMGVSAWMVWLAGGIAALPVLLLYTVHLGVNAAWSWLFFGRQRLDLALIDSVLLWVLIAAIIIGFASFSLVAALLLLPYLAWVSVATALNFRLLQLNGRRGQARAAD